MKNILTIFKNDVFKVRYNVVALITIIGLVLIPSLYAWFNIAASWDPYKNTGNLQVAVANMDQGYSSKMLPVPINLGEEVISTLHENTLLDWVFTDEDTAIEGVKSGKYYAAIVIPDSFSEDMMSLFSTDVQHSALVYYSNQKKSAIAPKVTDKTTTKVQNQIDQIFTEAITNIGIDLVENLSDYIDTDNATAMVGQLVSNLDEIEVSLNSAASTVDAFANMTDSLSTVLTTTSGLLDDSALTSSGSSLQLSSLDSDIKSVSSAIDTSAKDISKLLDQVQDCYTDIDSEIDTAFSSLGTDTENVKNGLAGLDSEVTAILTDYTSFRNSMETLRESLPADMTLLNEQLSTLIGKMDESIAFQQSLSDKLKEAQDTIDDAVSDVESTRSDLKELAEESASSISSVDTTYNSSVKSELSSLYSSLKNTASSVDTLLSQLESGTADISELTTGAAESVNGLQDILEQAADLLRSGADQIGTVGDKIEQALASDDLDALSNILASDPTEVSDFIAAPVSLNTIELYPVENYGSSMAPFYSILAVWVGGIIVVAMLKVNLTQEALELLERPRNYQLYFGRYLTCMCIGLLQALLLGLGDLLFLKIQCLHPFLFLLALLVSGFVFSLIMYTLTISFGDVGKAIAVVLLVIQLGGSGGTFPAEMTPKFFQMISPLLPFTHGMNAMRECIAGFYKMNYWKELGIMQIYVVLCLALGLVLRTPVIRLNNWITEEMEKTRFM